MDEKWHKVEVLVDRLIPWMIILLLIIIVGDIFFPQQVEAYHLHPWFVAGDWIVVSVFLADLIFKYLRVKHIPDFIRKYWLDILAVFPFILLFRVFEGLFSLYLAGETIKQSQTLLHEGLEIEREASRIVKETEVSSKMVREAEEIYKVSRTRYLARFARPIARLPRFLKYIPFFEKPTGKHHPHEKRGKGEKIRGLSMG